MQLMNRKPIFSLVVLDGLRLMSAILERVVLEACEQTLAEERGCRLNVAPLLAID